MNEQQQYGKRGISPWRLQRQLSLFTDELSREKALRLDQAVDEVRSRYGFAAVRRACTLVDRPLTDFNPKGDHTVHPVGYFQGRKMSDGII